MRVDRWRGLARVLAGTAVAVLLLRVLPGPFPPGADPANLVTFGRDLLGGTLAPYPPLLPALVGAAWRLMGRDLAATAFLLELLGPALLGATALALRHLVRAAGAPAPAGALALALGAGNGMLWLNVMWGGYPQLAALALSLWGLGDLLAFLRGERGPWRGGTALAAAVLTNPYPPFFAAWALLGILAAAPRFRPDRGTARELVVATVPAGVLAVGVYLPLALMLKPVSPFVDLGWTSTVLAVPLQAARAWTRWVLPAAGLVAGTALAWADPQGPRSTWGPATLAVLAAAAVLQALTFMNLSGRVLYVAAALASAGAADGFARAARRGLPVPGVRPGDVPDLVLAAAVVLAATGAAGAAAQAAGDADVYGPLDPGFHRAVEALEGEPPGDVVVAAPEPVTVDAWWLRAGTDRDVWIAGDPENQLMAGDFRRTQLAHAYLAGPAAVVRDRAAVVAGGCPGDGVRAFTFSGFEAVPALHLADPDLGVRDADGTPRYAEDSPWEHEVRGDRVVETTELGNATVHRTTAPAPGDAFRVTVATEDPVRRLNLTLWNPMGSRWSDLDATPDGLEVVAESEHRLGPRIQVDVHARNGSASVATDPAGQWARYAVAAPEAVPLALELVVHLPDARGPARALDLSDHLREEGAGYVYARSPPGHVVDRLQRDPGLMPLTAELPAGTLMYRVGDGTGGEAPCPRPR